MFIADLLTIWGEALAAVFDAEHPNERLRDIPISTDYPLREVDYPGLWINFSMQGAVRNMGIGHVEYEPATDAVTGDEGFREIYRWTFGGVIEITVATLGNLDRALLLDEVMRTLAVARSGRNIEGDFREAVENNDLIGMTCTWEELTLTGFGEQQGTPWGTDDVVYEATVSMPLIGEVMLEAHTGVLLPLSAVVISPETDPAVLPVPDPEAGPQPVPGQWV
jgi:hypothetical protein